MSRSCLLLPILLFLPAPDLAAQATYVLEGRMLDRDQPVDDVCQFHIDLWRTPEGNTGRIGQPRLYTRVSLKDGRFRLELNTEGEFGPAAFRGPANWLELRVKCSKDFTFSRFAGRQFVGEVTGGPYTLDGWNASGGGGTSSGGNYALSDTIGQPEAGSQSGGNYSAETGWWGAEASSYRIFLPLVLRPN